MPPNAAQVSYMMIVRNEEKNISRCLASLAPGLRSGLFKEVIVVDGQSSDKTAALARKHGARVYVRKWPGFPAQKKWALAQCKAPWVLSLDADETLTPALTREIAKVLKSPSASIDGYQIMRNNYFLGKVLRHCDWPDLQVRLVRRKAAEITPHPVHSAMDVPGSTLILKEPMNHYSYPDIQTWIHKMNRYTEIESTRLPARKSRFWLYYVFINPWIVFARMYIKRRGFLDGWHGLIYCCLAGISSFFLYAKLWALGLRR